MRARDSKRLVIDTDVARASGDEDATDPRAINCRDFLKEVRSQNHKVVMTRKISDEWKRHQSRFAFEWRVSMDARRKIDRINPPEDQTLQDKITTTTSDENEIEVMEKDFHLLKQHSQPIRPSFRLMKPSDSFSHVPPKASVKSSTLSG